MKVPALTRHVTRPREVPGELGQLADDPEVVSLRAQIAQVQSRLDETLARRDRAKRAGKAEPVARSVMARARDLIAGGQIPSSDPAAEYRATFDEEAILFGALDELNNQLAEVVGRLSHSASLLFAKEHVAALHRLDDALEAVHGAVMDMHSIVANLRSLGYEPSALVLGANVPRAALMIGDPKIMGSDAWTFRQWIAATYGSA